MDIADRQRLSLRTPRAAAVIVVTVLLSTLLVAAEVNPPADRPLVPGWVLAAMLACGCAVAALAVRFPDAARWRLGFALGVLLMAYVPIFATASLAPRTALAIVISTGATWWQVPVLLGSQLLVLVSVEQATGTSTRRTMIVVIALTAASLCLVLAAGPAPDAGIPWFIAPDSPVGAALRTLAATSLPLWLAALLITPLTAWWRAARMPRGDRAAAATVAVAAVAPLVVLIVCGALVVVTTLDGVPHALSYPILGLGLPIAVLVSVLLVRGPDDPRFRRGALVAFGATALLADAVLSVVAAVVVALAGSTVSALVALGTFIVLVGASVPAFVWVRSALASANAQLPDVADARQALVALALPPASEVARLESLTPREREVLELLARGLSNAGIARRLTTSPRTIDAHVRAVFMKLGTTQDPDENQRVRAAMRWVSVMGGSTLTTKSTDNLKI